MKKEASKVSKLPIQDTAKFYPVIFSFSTYFLNKYLLPTS